MIYENIKELCEKKNISIAALEKKAGMGNGTVAKWKRYDPNVANLTKVADALGVSVSRLIRSGGTNQKE